MATAIQRRRGNTSQHSGFTGLAGEITIDTDKNTVVVHDGSTAGGFPLAKAADVDALGGADITAVIAGSGLTGGSTSGNATIAIDYENLSGNLIPSANNTYSLGSLSNVWKDVFVGPGSLYVNGTKVLEDAAGTIQFTADTNQNISILTTGNGDLELTAGGDIQLKSNVVLSAGKTFTATGGMTLASNINMNSNNINNLDDPVVAQDAATKAYVDAQLLTKDNTDEITEGSTNLYFTNARADARVQAAIDTDVAFGSASDTLVPSQLAVKTYVDAQVDTVDALSELSGDTDDVTEGSTNLYFTAARARGNISVTDAGGDGSLAYNSSTGVITYTGPSASEVRAHISVTDAGGDGSMSYNSSTGVITYTGPSQAEANARIDAYISVTDAGGDGSLSVLNGEFTYTGPSQAEANTRIDARVSGGTGITYTGGVISTTDSEIVHDNLSGFVANEHIDHSGVSLTAGDGLSGGGDITTSRSFAVDSTVVRTSGAQTIAGAKTFSDDAVFSGNLTVSGTQTVVNTQTLAVADNIVVLNNGTSGSPSEDAGLTVDRGSSADVSLLWDESSDKWTFTNDGSTYQNIIGLSDLSAGGDLSYNSSTGVFSFTERTDSEVRGLVSVTDAGGDGSLAYNSSTGVITYTGPSASEVRAHFSGGTGITLSSGTISVTAGSIGPTQLENTTVTAASYGASGTIPTFTVDADGRLTAASNVAVTISHLSTTNLSEGTNLYYTTARANSAMDAYLTGGTGIAISSGTISLTDTGYISGVTAGTGLTGGGTSGNVTLNVSGLTVSEFAGGSIQTGSEAFSDSDTVLMTAAAVQDKILSYGYTTAVGDITGVTAGNGLTGGGSSGGVTLNVGSGYGITVNADTIETTNSEIRALFSGTDSGGDGSFSYNSTTGAFTYTGPSATEVRAHFSAGTGISISSGTISTDDSAIVHDSLSGFVANEHIDHSAVSITAGSGLTGGGTIAATRTINVGAGSYITVAADSVSVDATTTNTASKVVARDASGNVAASYFNGTASSAFYADLAEKYATDEELEAGTVVCFGGEAEVTACEHDADHKVAGVISTEPAYMMNSDAEGQFIALAGRVPCKVTGPVAKGDLLVSSSVKGHAKADNNAGPGRIIGKAIGSSEGGEAVIEVLVNMM